MKKIASVITFFALTSVGGAVLAGEAATSGEEIYNTKCSVCHASGVAGAPKFGDKEAWAPRIAQGMETLMQHATNGLRAMPPKGTCMDCTDEQLKAAVEYMVDNSK
jgi:cytochrome c5